MNQKKIEPCSNPEACNAQGCINPLGRCEEAAEDGRDPDDSVLVCASDLQHSAIFDSHEEERDCMNAIAKRLKDIAAAPQVVAEGWELPVATWFAIDHADGVQFHPSEEQALRYSESGQCVKYFSEDQMRAALTAAPVQAQEPVAETYAHTMSNGRGRPDDPAPFETVCVRLLRNDLPADLKLYAAPVQPVAVPDGKYGRLTGDNVAQPVQMKGKEK